MNKNTHKKRIRFITDSTSDIPPELVDRWKITVVPCFVNYNGHSYADDGKELKREQFFAELPNIYPFPTTAAPPPGIAEPLIKSALSQADHIVALTVPASLSGVYNSVRLACADIPPEQVTIIDSGQLCFALGFQVVVGAQVAEETGDLDQVLSAIQCVRDSTRLYVAAATLEFLRRSGRVNALVASVGSLLQIKPFLEVREGEVVLKERIRTFKSALQRLEELAREEAPLSKLAVLHINNEKDALELRDRLADIAPPDTVLSTISPTVGSHVGPGAVGVVTLKQNWRQ